MEALCRTLVWALFNEQLRWRGRLGGAGRGGGRAC